MGTLQAQTQSNSLSMHMCMENNSGLTLAGCSGNVMHSLFEGEATAALPTCGIPCTRNGLFATVYLKWFTCHAIFFIQ